MIRTIPLNKLVPSPRNVRRRSDPQADAELKANIAARGLLQNLVVAPAGKPRGCFAVEAGERRRKSLVALAEEGSIAKDHEVCCLVLQSAAAGCEASLAENFQRLAMNPADECLAFRQLIEQGTDAEGIARRFGLTVRFVEGRLRLAELAPVVFESLGAGEISLDVAKAYAATPDRERQAWVYEQLGRGYSADHPDTIRRMMTQVTVPANDRRALLVGEDAYVAAGGRIERDLFSDDAKAQWLDVALLERLANERMEQLAAEAAAQSGLAFVRPVLDGFVRQSAAEGLRRVPLEAPPLTDDETARVDALDGEIEELAELIDHEGADEQARIQAEIRVRELRDAIEAIVDRPPVLPETLRPQVGGFLLLDDQGRARLDTSFYSETVPETAGGGEDAGGDDPIVSTRGRPPGLSQRLVDELSIQRRDILAVHVASDPGLALDLAIFLMIDREADRSFEKSGSSLAAGAPSNPIFDFKTPDAAATIAREQANAMLDRSWVKGDTRAARFDAFRALPDEARAAWLAHAVARTLEASLNLKGERRCAFHDHLGGLLGIDVAQWWRPTGANYFDRVPKSVTLAALEAVGGPALAGRYAKAKKAELSQACERIFSGDFIAEVEVKEAALAWVPEAMRFAAASPDAPEEPVDHCSTGNGPEGGGADAPPAADGASPIKEAA